MKYCYLRDFRIQFRISAQELARESGFSQQRLSEIELMQRGYAPNEETRRKIVLGIEKIIENRERSLTRLKNRYEKDKDHLFDLKTV